MTQLVTTGKVEELHRLASQHAGNAVQYAIECGRELIRIKTSLPHGEFGKWCEGLSFGHDMRAKYMRAATVAPQISATTEISSLRGLLAATARPKTTSGLDVKCSGRDVKRTAPSRVSDANKRRIQDIDEARARGVSMLTTYARLTLTALRSQTSFSDEEKKVLEDLAAAIQQVSEFQG